MAPLPQNNTALMYFDYTTGNTSTSQEHTFVVRTREVLTATQIANVQAAAGALLTGITPGNLRQGWKVIRARKQDAGANFSLPVPLDAFLTAFVGTGPSSSVASAEALEWSFQGRSQTSGRRASVSIYGLVLGIPATLRLDAVGTGWVGSAVGALNDASEASVGWDAIDGTQVSWYPYVNANYNSYWERELRS